MTTPPGPSEQPNPQQPNPQQPNPQQGQVPPGQYPGGSHPGAPVPTGQYPPGAYPPGQYPPGAVPPGQYPPGQYPPGAYPPGPYGQMPGQYQQPPRPKSSTKWLKILVGPAVLLLILGVVTLFSGGGSEDKNPSTEAFEVGDCVMIDADEAGKPSPREVSCGTEDFHFRVALRPSMAAACGEYSSFWIDRERSRRRGGSSTWVTDVMCMAPAYQVDRCYTVPTSATGSLSDIREVGCTETPASGMVIFRIDSVSTDPTPPDCELGPDAAVFYEDPSPIGYCQSLP